MGQVYLYIIQHGSEDVCKIGISSNPEERLKGLQTGTPRILTLIAMMEFASREIALGVESLLHMFFDENRLNGEWFEVNPSHVCDIYQKLHDLYNVGLVDFPDIERVNNVVLPPPPKSHNYNGNATQRAIEYYTENPEDLDVSPRDLIDKVGVKKSTLYNVRKMFLENE